MNGQCIDYREAFPQMKELPADRWPMISVLDGEINGRDSDGNPIRKNWSAHRLIWTITNGPIPNGFHVAHTCGNKHCINLNHLALMRAGQHAAKPKTNNLEILRSFISQRFPQTLNVPTFIKP